MRPERSPALPGEHSSRGPNGSHSPTEVLHVHDSSASYRSHSRTRVKSKGKRRASTHLLSPHELDMSYRSPVSPHKRTKFPEVLVTPNLSLFENIPERNTTVSCTSTGDVREASPSVSQVPESDSGDTPVVSPHLPDGNPSIACAAHTTNDRLSPLNGLHSLNDEVISSSSSNSETPKPLTINTNQARANPMRRPRYRSQRDAIMAHLRGSVTTPRRSTQSLLARMTDQSAMDLDVVSGDDDADSDVAKRTVAGTPIEEGPVNPFTYRTAECSSGLSDSDDPPEGSRREDPEDTTATRAGVHLIQFTLGMIFDRSTSSQRGRLIASNFVNVFILLCTEVPQQEPPGPTPPRSGITSSSSHAHLLDKLYDDDEKATTTEARLRTQVRLRARLAAERRLAHENVHDDGVPIRAQ